MEKQSLKGWLHEVLTVQARDASLVLTDDGREASVTYEDGCVIAYTYDGEGRVVTHARIRLVTELEVGDEPEVC